MNIIQRVYGLGIKLILCHINNVCVYWAVLFLHIYHPCILLHFPFSLFSSHVVSMSVWLLWEDTCCMCQPISSHLLLDLCGFMLHIFVVGLLLIFAYGCRSTTTTVSFMVPTLTFLFCHKLSFLSPYVSLCCLCSVLHEPSIFSSFSFFLYVCVYFFCVNCASFLCILSKSCLQY